MMDVDELARRVVELEREVARLLEREERITAAIRQEVEAAQLRAHDHSVSARDALLGVAETLRKIVGACDDGE